METIELFIFLLQKEKTTCKEIANKFRCCERTAHRKVQKLSLVVPIVTIQGFGGGVLILPEYKKDFIRRVSNN